VLIAGAHVIVYSKDAENDRVFSRDVLQYPAVDAGHGWLIFALPPAETAFHPSEKNDMHELYFMCDNLKSTVESLKGNQVNCGPVTEALWGSLTPICLPGGGTIGLYQPKHPTAIGRGVLPMHKDE